MPQVILDAAHDIKVGDRVRSYDFEGREDCYVEGIVIDMGEFPQFPGCARYEIRATKRVWGSKEEGDSRLYYPPVNGISRLFHDTPCMGVVKV